VHEAILAGQILRSALAQTGRPDAPRMTRLLVKVGELEAVSPDALRTAFEDQARGTEAMGAELLVESIPAKLTCEACGNAESLRHKGDASSCSRCGSARLRLEGRGWTVSIVGGPQ